MNSVLISVIIPVYNGEKYVKDAIESIFNQSYKSIEIIVIDDGSIDNTASIVSRFPEVIYFFQENQGVASARNKGLSLAKGEYIAFLDADDTYLIDKLKIHIDNSFENNNVLTIEEQYHYNTNEKIGLITMLTSKKVFQYVGDFNLDYVIASDYEWVTRAKELGFQVDIIDDKLLKRRIHTNNLSVVHKLKIKEYRFKIIKESILRKNKIQTT